MEGDSPGAMTRGFDVDQQQQQQFQMIQQPPLQQQWSQGVNNGDIGQPNDELNAIRQQQMLQQQIAMSQQHAMAPMMSLSPMMQQQTQQGAMVMPGIHQGQLATSPVVTSGSYLMVQGGNDGFRSDLMTANPALIPPQPAQTPPNDDQRVWHQQQFQNAGFGGMRYNEKAMEDKNALDFYQQQQHGYEYRSQDRATVAQMALAAQHPAAIAMAAAAAAAAQQMSQSSQFYAPPGMPPPSGPTQSPPPAPAITPGLMPADVAAAGSNMQMPPRPRPEGGLETSSVGCPADSIVDGGGSEALHFDGGGGLKKNISEELIIDSWAGDDSDLNAAQQQRSMPPPNYGWGAPPPPPMSGGWGAPPPPDTMKVGSWHQPPPMQFVPPQGGRGRGEGGRNFGGQNRGGGGGGNRYGRGSERPYSSQDHTKEKLDGRTSAIAETMAMMKKMAIEDKERKKESEERRRKRNEELGMDGNKEGNEDTSVVNNETDGSQEQEESKDNKRQNRSYGGGGGRGSYGGRGGMNFGGRGGGRGSYNSRDFNRFMGSTDPTSASLMMMNMAGQTGTSMMMGPPTTAAAAAAAAAAQAQRLFPGLENFMLPNCPPATTGLTAPPYQPGMAMTAGPVPPFLPHFAPGRTDIAISCGNANVNMVADVAETGMRGGSFTGYRGRAPPTDPSLIMMPPGQGMAARGGFQQFRGQFQRTGGGRGPRPSAPGGRGQSEVGRKNEYDNDDKVEKQSEGDDKTAVDVVGSEEPSLETIKNDNPMFNGASNVELVVAVDLERKEGLVSNHGLSDVKDCEKSGGEVGVVESKSPEEAKEESTSNATKSKSKKGKKKKKKTSRSMATTTASAMTSTNTTTKTRMTLDTELELSLRERLTLQLERGSSECMVCLERIRVTHAIWSCRGGCFQVFHIHCMKKWARSNTEESGSWRCPGCQRCHGSSSLSYHCFCLKIREPEYIRGDTPHSCGQVCGIQRDCGHKCIELCHPGPCPPCTVSVKRSCPCGKSERRQRCSDRFEFTCGGPCEKLMNCGHHRCQLQCHSEPCVTCDQLIEQYCHCGKEERKVVCDSSTFGQVSYSCNKKCDKALSCGHHNCCRVCHDGPCGPCPLSKVDTCHCTKVSLDEMGVSRMDCTHPVPSCGQECRKKLECGHECQEICHEGPCPPCKLMSTIKCRCGWSDQNVACVSLKDGVEVRCNRRCGKKRPCGRHKCNEICCDAEDHTCTLSCNKRLSCGNHRCEEPCHRGPCPSCPHVSFDDLSCHCGHEVVHPPIACGQRRPECLRICQREHSCDHVVRHTCHAEPRCPPCTELTERLCYGHHEVRKNVHCHIEGVSCGKECDKELSCGRHRCIKICHEGPCEEEGQQCTQPCQVVREGCGHKCNAPCHPAPCPNTKCMQKVRVVCECGHLKAWRVCGDQQSDYRKLQLSMAMRSEGGVEGASNILNRGQKLPCNEDCRQRVRNQQLALALQIKNPDLVPSRLAAPNFSDMLKEWVKRDAKFVQMVHEKLTQLVKLAKESKQKSRCHSFPVMNREKRAFVHEYCVHFGCSSDSFDAEPNRNVVATAERIKAFLPSQSLVDAVQKQRKAPGPIIL